MCVSTEFAILALSCGYFCFLFSEYYGHTTLLTYCFFAHYIIGKDVISDAVTVYDASMLFQT